MAHVRVGAGTLGGEMVERQGGLCSRKNEVDTQKEQSEERDAELEAQRGEPGSGAGKQVAESLGPMLSCQRNPPRAVPHPYYRARGSRDGERTVSGPGDPGCVGRGPGARCRSLGFRLLSQALLDPGDHNGEWPQGRKGEG